MQIQRRSPLHGLAAGLLSFIAFAAAAVGMASGGTSGSTGNTAASTTAAQTVAQGEPARFIATRDGDEADGHGHQHH
jgi:hypothetical protein